jgi:hypothetical protein
MMMMMIIIIMYYNSNFSGKYWAIIGSKLSGPPRDPDYRGTTVYFKLCAYVQMTVTEVFYLTTLSIAKIIRRWR